MAGYIERSLGKDERVLVRATPSLKPFWFNFLLGGFLVLIALVVLLSGEKSAIGAAPVILVIGVVFALPPLVRRMTNEMALTNRRLVAKTGLIAVRTVEIKAQKIESVQVRQSIFGRLLNFGTLVVTGTGSSHAPLFAIDAPVEFRRQFEDALEEQVAQVA